MNIQIPDEFVIEISESHIDKNKLRELEKDTFFHKDIFKTFFEKNQDKLNEIIEYYL